MPRLPAVAGLVVVLVGGGLPAVAVAGSPTANPVLAPAEQRPDLPVLVIAAGPPSDGLDAAVSTVAEGLKQAGHPVSREVQRVVEDEPSTVRDRAINTGAEFVVIVRYGDGQAGDLSVGPSFAFYDHNGVPVGQVDPSPAASASAAPPIRIMPRRVEPESASDKMEERTTEYQEALGTYRDERVRVAGVGLGSFDFVRDGGGLKNEDVYTSLGREDLARKYKRRKRVRGALFLTGTAVIIGGLIGGIALGIAGEKHGSSSQQAAGIGLAVAAPILGPAGLLAVAAIKRHPVKRSEAEELADQYNAALRRRLHLHPNAASIRIGALASRNGGGLAISGRF